MRYHAPARDAVRPEVFQRPPLSHWYKLHPQWLGAAAWPTAAELGGDLAAGLRFATQDPALLADGLHYEQRIAEQGVIATRAENWHDLLNALIWLRYPQLKRALNQQQMLEIAKVGPRTRSRVQCALTHFDEAGVMVRVGDPQLVAAWDRHDWDALFCQHRAAWQDGRLHCEVFGHAVLEYALGGEGYLLGKALLVYSPPDDPPPVLAEVLAAGIASRQLLRDPQELRPLPLSGIPGWHGDNHEPGFYQQAPCFRPLRPGRVYPPPSSAVAV